MGKKLIPEGTRFSRLVVVRESSERKGRAIMYECRCDCGALTTVAGTALRFGIPKSCGCLTRDVNRINGANRRNPLVKSPTHNTWWAMTQRCRDPKVDNYRWYGGRGISVCERWSGRNGFVNFVSDMGERPGGMTLDRIDPHGDYEPGNCRWATWDEQIENRMGVRGTRCRDAKFTEAQVQEIRELCDKGAVYAELAREHDVHQSTISLIAKRKTWTWLPEVST